MTFASVSGNREQLSLLSQLLLAVFPGCVIHQSCDPMRTATRLSTQKVDAVFVDADTCANAMDILHKQRMQAQICFLCRQEAVLPKEVECFHGVLSYPLTEQKIRAALQMSCQDFSGVDRRDNG